MREKDQARTKLWVDDAQANPRWLERTVYVNSIGPAEDSRYGLCQFSTLMIDKDTEISVNIFAKDPQFVLPEFTGKIKFSVFA